MAQNVLRSGRAAGGVAASIIYVASKSYSFVVASMFAIRRPWRCLQNATRWSKPANNASVRYGSKADLGEHIGDVRFTPKNGHAERRRPGLLSANSRRPIISSERGTSTGRAAASYPR